MDPLYDTARRRVMAALAGLPLTGMALASDANTGGRQQPPRILVTYFSRSGNTRVIAGLIHRQLGTDLFEIRPAAPYPDDYLETVAQAEKERTGGVEPALASTVPDMANYDTVFLGFPIWGQTAPAVIRSFLSQHDLSGKTLIPFITHGGYGLGSSRAVLTRHAPKATLLDGFVLEADQERRTMETVTAWLKGVPVRGQGK